MLGVKGIYNIFFEILLSFVLTLSYRTVTCFFCCFFFGGGGYWSRGKGGVGEKMPAVRNSKSILKGMKGAQ